MNLKVNTLPSRKLIVNKLVLLKLLVSQQFSLASIPNYKKVKARPLC